MEGNGMNGGVFKWPDPLKEFDVAVFVENRSGRVSSFRAYTLWYNPNWKECNMVRISAKNGTEAKKKAIQEIKRRISNNEPVNVTGGVM
jgi:hypothetical protein